MKRFLLFISLVVIGFSAFSQSPSLQISLRPAYPLAIGDTIVDKMMYSSNGLYLYDVDVDQLPRYEIGYIDTQYVTYSENGYGFYIKADSLHSQDIVYSYEVNEMPKGNIVFNESTGRFKFYPKDDDYNSFVVTFRATNGTDYVSENVEFNLMAQVPTETDAFHSKGIMPDFQDYTTIAYTSKDTILNNYSRTAYSYSISGKDVVFDDGLKNKVWGLNNRENIYELNIYAERLIIRSALSFPETNITIFAKELIFEDKGNVVSSISTTPSRIKEPTEGSGIKGANAGNITLNIKEFKGNMGIRFILQGAQGQDSNKNGYPGRGGSGGILYSTVDVSSYCDCSKGRGGIMYDTESNESLEGNPILRYGNSGFNGQVYYENDPYAFLHPYYIEPVLRHANDAYINNYTDSVLDICHEYKSLINEYLNRNKESESNDSINEGIIGDIGDLLSVGAESFETEPLASNTRTEVKRYYDENKGISKDLVLQNNLMEIEKMLFKLEQRLDYFGNPEGWVPLLSFEVLLSTYEEEINRAIPTLYLSYWLQGIDRKIEQQVEASLLAANMTEEDLQLELENLKRLTLTKLPNLQDEADEVSAEVDKLIKKIEKLEKKLYAKAKHNVKKRNRLKKFFGIGKAVASVISCIPGWGTAIGTALNVGFTVADGFVDDGSSVSFNTITDAVKSTTANKNFFSDISSSVSKAKESISGNNLKDLESACNSILNTAMPLINSISNVGNLLSKSSTSKSEVMKEYNKLLANSSLWKQYNNDYAVLDAKKTQLLNDLNQTFSDMTTTMSDINNDVLTLDAFKRDAFNGNSKRDLNAMLYLEKMEQRSKNQLLKYHYYVRKAYEYRLLEPYDSVDYNLVGMFERFEKIAASDTVINRENYNSLSSIFWGDLSNMANKILEAYMVNRSEQTAPVTIVIPKEQLDALNNGENVILNFHDMGVFSPEEENIRIVKLEIQHLNTHVVGQVGETGYMDLDLTHSGISEFSKNGHLYWFDHMSKDANNPHTWGVRFNAYNNEITAIQPSVASSSLLYSIIGNNSDNIMLFSRPSAWSDITLSKNVHTIGGADIIVDSLVLKLQYDFTKRPQNYCTIDIKSSDGLLPYIACSVEDINGRKNGHGSFSRLYQRNSLEVNFNAVDKYETYHFVNWTDKGGKEVSGQNYLPAKRNKDQKFIANYERRVPILEVQDTIKVGNAGGKRSVRIRNVGKGDIEMDWYVEYADSTRSETDTWVQLNGTVEGINDGEFTFDYRPNETGAIRMDSLEIFVPETDEMSKVIYIVQVDNPQDIAIFADTLNLIAGGDGAITIKLDNKIPITVVDFDLYLPEGVKMKTDEAGKMEVTLNQDRSNGHLLEVEQRANGLYHFYINSSGGNSLIGNSGELLRLNMTCDKDVTGSKYEGVIKNIILYGSNKNVIAKPDTTFVINVQSFEMGDVNHDNNVDVADVMLMVKYVMQKTPSPFFIENADVNGDGRYDVSDVMGIVKISLGKKANAPVGYQSEGLYLQSHENIYMLSMENASVFTAFQAEIIVPNGCRLVGVELSKGCESSHQVSYKDLGNGRYNLMVYSMGDKTFSIDGNLLRFIVEGKQIGEIMMEDIRFTDQECNIIHFKSPQRLTNVEGLENNGDVHTYYDLKGVKTATPTRGVYIQNGKKKTVK